MPEDHSKHPYVDQSMCIPMAKWQQMPHPTCNAVHELDLYGPKFSRIGSGGWRMAWKVSASVDFRQGTNMSTGSNEVDNNSVVLKTIRCV